MHIVKNSILKLSKFSIKKSISRNCPVLLVAYKQFYSEIKFGNIKMFNWVEAGLLKHKGVDR